MRKLIVLLLLLFCVVVAVTHAQSITSEDDTSWYKSQIGQGLGQCGPTCVAMIIERSGPSTTIQQIRAQLPPGPADGGTDFNDLLGVINTYDIYYQYLGGLSEWSGEGIVLILLNPIYVSEVPYEYDGSHYIILVGEKDDKYIVNDPFIGTPIRYYSKDAIARARYYYIIWIP